jgi:SAM-dependent methyltransferase
MSILQRIAVSGRNAMHVGSTEINHQKRIINVLLNVKLKEGIKVIRKNRINYVLDNNGRIKKFKPWLGDIFSFMYDRIMEKSIFPKKFRGDISKHYDILKNEYQNLTGKNLLEIASGSGFSASLLNRNNSYSGIDISSGLLKLAEKRFSEKGFEDFELFVADASDLPFSDEYFDIVFCDLSLNFLGDIETFIIELKRVMKKDSCFYCSVPIPERKDPKVVIHGNLYSENELKTWFEKYNFHFNMKPVENGALAYFEATKVSPG